MPDQYHMTGQPTQPEAERASRAKHENIEAKMST